MRSIVFLLTALAFAMPVGADHCSTYNTSAPEIDTGPSETGVRFYVDNDICQGCLWSIWVYQESNGFDGLQRGDEVVDDTCHGIIPHDTIIF